MKIEWPQGTKTKSKFYNGSGGAAGYTLAANSHRIEVIIQNLGTNTVAVKLGSGAYAVDLSLADGCDVLLPACTADYDGTVAPLVVENYKGIVTLATVSGAMKVRMSELVTLAG